MAGTFLIGEILADYVLSPRIIGSRVKLNPVWLIFALFAFGYLFGFVGLVVAIPLAASLGVVLRFAMRQSLTGSELEAVPAPSAFGAPATRPVSLGREIGQSAEEAPTAGRRDAMVLRPSKKPDSR